MLIRARSSDATGRAALTELWMSHGKLVAAIAARYRRADIEHDDLINAGHLGLHTAITRFDTERFDVRLASFAAIWIRGHIHDYIRRNAGPVRLPESKAHRQLAQSGAKLLAEARKSCEREGVEPTDSELHGRVGRRLGLGADEVATSLNLLRGGHDMLGGEDGTAGDDARFRDEAAPTADDVIGRMDRQRLRERLMALVEVALGERERAVFLARSMASTNAVPPLEEFAALWGVSPTRVSQIEQSARRKIATALPAFGYADPGTGGVATPSSGARAQRRPSHSVSEIQQFGQARARQEIFSKSAAVE